MSSTVSLSAPSKRDGMTLVFLNDNECRDYVSGGCMARSVLDEAPRYFWGQRHVAVYVTPYELSRIRQARGGGRGVTVDDYGTTYTARAYPQPFFTELKLKWKRVLLGALVGACLAWTCWRWSRENVTETCLMMLQIVGVLVVLSLIYTRVLPDNTKR